MHLTSIVRLVPSLAFAALLWGCGSTPPPEPPPASPIPPPPSEGAEAADNPMMEEEPAAPAASAEPAATAEPAAKPTWASMTHDQRLERMKTEVLPTMSASFKAFDAAGFAHMSCVTCHGPGAKEGKFGMPNPELPKLPKDGNFAKLPEKATAFMKQQVVPEMAAMLNMAAYDPATQQGFGCFNCHTPKP
jgi:cytochrome c551/c552